MSCGLYVSLWGMQEEQKTKNSFLAYFDFSQPAHLGALIGRFNEGAEANNPMLRLILVPNQIMKLPLYYKEYKDNDFDHPKVSMTFEKNKQLYDIKIDNLVVARIAAQSLNSLVTSLPSHFWVEFDFLLNKGIDGIQESIINQTVRLGFRQVSKPLGSTDVAFEIRGGLGRGKFKTDSLSAANKTKVELVNHNELTINLLGSSKNFVEKLTAQIQQGTTSAEEVDNGLYSNISNAQLLAMVGDILKQESTTITREQKDALIAEIEKKYPSAQSIVNWGSTTKLAVCVIFLLAMLYNKEIIMQMINGLLVQLPDLGSIKRTVSFGS